jgi:hypothetical protein
LARSMAQVLSRHKFQVLLQKTIGNLIFNNNLKIEEQLPSFHSFQLKKCTLMHMINAHD